MCSDRSLQKEGSWRRRARLAAAIAVAVPWLLHAAPDGSVAIAALDSAQDPAVARVLEEAALQPRLPRGLFDAIDEGGTPARQAMIDYLNARNPRPETVAGRAAALRAALRRTVRDPARFAATEALLREVALHSICAPRILNFQIREGYVPPAATFAYDFGAPGRDLASGFAPLTPLSSGLRGSAIEAQSGAGQGAVFGDGVSGLAHIRLQLPNGRYRLILLLSPTVGPQYLGRSIRIQGSTHYVGSPEAQDWIHRALLQSPDPTTKAAPELSVFGEGPGLYTTTSVADGTLTLEFDPEAIAGNGPFTGLLVELISQPSSLILENEAIGYQTDLERCLTIENALARIFDQDLGIEDPSRPVDRVPPLPDDDGGPFPDTEDPASPA